MLPVIVNDVPFIMFALIIELDVTVPLTVISFAVIALLKNVFSENVTGCVNSDDTFDWNDPILG